MKINGTLKSNRSLEELQVAINEICKSSQISPGSYVDGAPNIQSYMLNAGIKEIQTFIHMLSLLLLLFSFITLFLYTILKIEKNLKYYAILQLSGFSLREICEVVIGDIVTILLISDLISIFVSQVILALLGAKAAYMGMFIMINAGIFASTIITVIYKFKHYELIEFLREE